MLKLFTSLGAQVQQKWVHVPNAIRATVATVANGEVIFLPGERQMIPGRPIVGAVFQITDLAALRRVLEPAVQHRSVKVQTKSYRSLFVRPQDSHGIWLEFREQL
jgi:hypothetical protein